MDTEPTYPQESMQAASRSRRSDLGSRREFWQLAAIVAVALILGGGGSKYGLANLTVQWVALIVLAFNGESFWKFWVKAPRAIKILAGLTIALPLVQLVPLPESIWQQLPGREAVAASFELIGKDGWAAVSVYPARTALALSALIVPLAILALGWSASLNTLISLGWLIVLLGLFNLILGVPQVLSNGATGLLYPENPKPGVLFGAFANRNSTGLFLVGALALSAMLPFPRALQKSETLVRVTIITLLLLAIFLTRSRTALVLAALPIGLMALRYLITLGVQGRSNPPGSRNKIWIGIGAIALSIVAGTSLVAVAPGRVSDTVERFSGLEDDARFIIWEDAAYAGQVYWPIGAGAGSFDDVFQVHESLENVTPKTAGRAHNDYLEVTIEAGLPGLALIAAWLILIAWLTWKASASPQRWIAWSGAVVLLAIALQSLTDYPLRNLSNLALASVSMLILLCFGMSKDRVKAERS